MSKIEKYLGIANHDIQVANNSNELKSYVASILCEIDELQQENKKQKEVIDKVREYISSQMIAYDDGEDCGVDCECDGFKLLDILKGSD